MAIVEVNKKDDKGKKKKRQYMQGRFIPRNPKKYIGDKSKIVYRSSWELKVMNHLDLMDKVIYWASEELVVPYRSPKDYAIHRYFPDFIVVFEGKYGRETIIIEVKPYSQQFPPKKTSGKRKDVYANEVMTYMINQAKWEAARAYCDSKGYKFAVMTEKEILGKL